MCKRLGFSSLQSVSAKSVSTLVLVGGLLVGCGAAVNQAPPPKVGTETPSQKTLGHPDAIVTRRSSDLPPATATTGQVVFLRAGSVWMMGPDGEAPQQLTVRGLDSPDEMPRVSPDGTHLSYASAKDGMSKIYVQSMQDMIPNAITTGSDHEAAWSPDGHMLAFMRGDKRMNRDLYVVDANGETAPRLLLAGDDDHPELGGSPIWSADGTAILLSADRREHSGTGLWQVNVQSGVHSRILQAPGVDWHCDRSANLSPDGTHLVFASNRHASSGDDAGDYDVYRMRLDGSGLTRLTDDPGTIATPVYSRDGLRLYFASSRMQTSGFEWEIFVMAADGGKQRRLTKDEHPENHAPFLTVPSQAQ